MAPPRRALAIAAFLIVMIFLFKHSSSTSIRTVAVKAETPSTTAPTSSPSPSVPAARNPAVVQVQPPRPKKDTTGMSLEDKLAYQFPYDVEARFPAYIWQTWKYTPASGDFGEEFRTAEASWTEMHPGFVHEVVTDAVALHLMRYLYAGVPEVLEAYEAMPIPILKADFFRYLILLARGGIYSDIDTHALKSAVEWIPENVPRSTVGLVIGIEADPDRPDWKEWYSRRIQFCQWTIQAKAGHPVLRKIVAKITRDTLARKKAGTLKNFDHDKVVDFTGPAIWTDIIFDHFNDPKYYAIEPGMQDITWEDFTGMTGPKKVGDVVVLPITSFSPGQMTMGSLDIDSPMAFVKHDFEGMFIHLSGRVRGES